MDIRKIAAWILAFSIVFVLTSCAFADESEIPWGASKSSIIEKMGEPDESEPLEKEGEEQIRYRNVSISKYSDALLGLIFRNRGLVARFYGLFDNKELEKYYYLRDALIVKYGESSDSAQILYDGLGKTGYPIESITPEALADEFYKSGAIYKTWEAGKETNIILTTIPIGDVYTTALIYYQPDNQINGYNMNGL
jgi:hypothetical protein